MPIKRRTIAERHASRFTAFRIRLARIISVINWRRRYYHVYLINWRREKRLGYVLAEQCPARYAYF